ncbi:MAG: phage terminase large subunit [Henriciella sp.]
MTFKLTAKQEELRQLLRGPQTHTMAFGGSRSGKTFGFVHTVVKRASLAPNSQHLLARFRHADARTKLMMKTLPEVMRMAYPELSYKVNKHDQFAVLPNGAELWFQGLDDDERTDKILGSEYATIYLNECSQLSFGTVEKVRSRLAQNVGKENGKPLALRMYYDLNPETASHWSYQEFVAGMNPIDGHSVDDPGDYATIQMNPTDNPHLSENYLRLLSRMSMLQRKRFYDGDFLLALPDSLWTPDMIAEARQKETPHISAMKRIVVSVDPGGTVKGDKTGIIVAGIDYHNEFHILADLSLNGTPAEWAYMVVWAYRFFDADCIVVETNFGADMCQHTIRTAAPPEMRRAFRVKEVCAKRGKVVRAEKIVGSFENGEVSFSEELYAHWPTDENAPKRPAGHETSTELFDQLMSFVPGDTRRKGKSPDNGDAMVYALIELSGQKRVGVDRRPRVMTGLAGNRVRLG